MAEQQQRATTPKALLSQCPVHSQPMQPSAQTPAGWQRPQVACFYSRPPHLTCWGKRFSSAYIFLGMPRGLR